MTKIIGISGRKQSGKSTLADYLRVYYELKIRGFTFPIRQNESTNFEVIADTGLIPEAYEQSIIKVIVSSEFEESHVRVYSFADALKEICVDVLGLTKCQVYGTDEQKNSLTGYSWLHFPMNIQLQKKIPIENTMADKMKYMTAREVMQVFGTDIMRKMFDDKIWVNTTLNRIKKDSPDIAIIPDTRFPSEIESLKSMDSFVIRLSRDICPGDSHASETSLDSFNFESELGDNFLKIEDVSIEEKNKAATDFLLKVI